MAQHGARKVAAISAGVAILALGATYTLASWNDSEWVWGGTDGGDAAVGTSTFDVEQNIDITDADGWGDFEDAPGQGLVFTAGALDLTPGDSIFAPVSLRTIAGSIAGTVTLQGAVPAEDGGVAIGNDPDGALWDAIQVTVYTSSAATPPACTAADEADWGAPITGLDGVGLGTNAGASQVLPAGADESTAGVPQHYCFKLTLPATAASQDLQGLSIAPAWEFAAESD